MSYLGVCEIGISIDGYEWEGEMEIACPVCKNKIEERYSNDLIYGKIGFFCKDCNLIIFTKPAVLITKVESQFPERKCINCKHHKEVKTTWKNSYHPEGYYLKCNKDVNYETHNNPNTCCDFERQDLTNSF